MAHWHQLTRAANLALGQSVRTRRLAAGLTQRDLGQRCCIRYEFIGKMERGIGNPSLGTMAIVAEALGCKVSDLLSRATSGAVTLRADDMRRAKEALAVLGSVLMTRRKRAGERMR